MKKILLSAGMIVFMGALMAGATGAFFSDSETSTGNTFTAGEIDLTVDSKQTYNGQVCTLADHDNNAETAQTYAWVGGGDYPVAGTPCDGTWEPANLGAQKFFNFGDVKPGDEGSNSISLHVDSNDAYACIDVAITSNDDETCTDPENEAEGAGICGTDGLPEFDGELAENLEFFAWADTDGDNVWDAAELPLFSNVIGPASDALDGESYTIADSVLGSLPGGSTSWVGLAWCAGDMTVVAPGDLNCDGAAMGNEAQSDEMISNIAFRIEQARNNDAFVCEAPVPQPEV